MARILVLGGNGQVGFELARTLDALGEVRAASRPEVDLADLGSLQRVVQSCRPQIVINAAADTAVDRAETHFVESHAANAIAPAILADACRAAGARLIHFSTDYVFDGTKNAPYVETDPTNPVNAYGRAKLGGEAAVLANDPHHLVFRLSWIYSWRGHNFALTMLRLAREGKRIRVVSDQVGSPTYAPHVAAAMAKVVANLLADPGGEGGLFHLTSGGQTNWSGFAQALLNEAMGADSPTVEPIPSADYPTPAARPAYSVLDSGKAHRRFGVMLPSWQEGVSAWAKDLRSGQVL